MRSSLPSLLLRGALLTMTAALAILNGLPLTAFFDSISYILYLFARGSSFIGRDALFHATSVFIAVMTFLVGGIPAALYERLRGLPQSTPASLVIWLVATALLSWESLKAAVRLW
jgi:hypothetical protein